MTYSIYSNQTPPPPPVPNDLRNVYPEFSTLTDQQIQYQLTLAGYQIQFATWGQMVNYGILAYSAHYLCVRYYNQLTLGEKLKAIESDKSRSTPAVPIYDSFATTPYGLEYLSLLGQLPLTGFVIGSGDIFGYY